ncbi:MAG TPA: hypothetical protein VF715_01895 [Thermoleophilaceae bacterium]|jgi:hypothetical protein
MDFGKLVRRLMLGRKIEDGIEGVALVHSRSRPPHPTPKYIGGAKLNLVVELPGREPYKVKLKCSAPGDKYPHPGQVVPVLADRRDPKRVQVDWDKMLSADEQFERLTF